MGVEQIGPSPEEMGINPEEEPSDETNSAESKPIDNEQEVRLNQAKAVFALNERKIKNLEEWVSKNSWDNSSAMELAKLKGDQDYRQRIIENEGREEPEDLPTQTQTERKRSDR